jgi:glycosyltransferase involved in cell wall biosynthesis
MPGNPLGQFDEINMDLTVIILTFNEAIHIERCIRSVQALSSEILVVDSFSTDNTVELARACGARVVQHPFVNYAEQLNWALEHVSDQSDWVLRIDADEYLTDELVLELDWRLDGLPDAVTGLVVRRRIRFLGGWVCRGGFGALWVLRVWRRGSARCESRWMDEHMALSHGEARKVNHPLVDDNLNDIAWWTHKHLGYAAREAIDLLNLRHGFLDRPEDGSLGVRQAKLKRLLKERVYAQLPLGLRPVLYYGFRMILQLGLLDSRSGRAFHFLQGLWYRVIVDIRVWEVERRMKNEHIGVVEAIRRQFKVDPLAPGNGG